jgi:hypothetical protein
MNKTLYKLNVIWRYCKLPMLYSFLNLVVITIGNISNTRHEYTLFFVLIVVIFYLTNISEITKNERNLLTKIINFTLFVLFASPIIIYSIVLLVSVSPNFYVRIGSIDAWISFSGSIIGGVMVMFALVFTIQVEQENRRVEKEDRDIDYALRSIPILVANYSFNTDDCRHYSCKKLEDEKYELHVHTSMIISNISEYLAKNLIIKRFNIQYFSSILEDKPLYTLNLLNYTSKNDKKVVPQNMNVEYDFSYMFEVEDLSKMLVSIEVHYSDSLGKIQHEFIGTSEILIQVTNDYAARSEYAKLSICYSPFKNSFIK